MELEIGKCKDCINWKRQVDFLHLSTSMGICSGWLQLARTPENFSCPLFDSGKDLKKDISQESVPESSRS